MKKISLVGTIECEPSKENVEEALGFSDIDAFRQKLSDIGGVIYNHREQRKTDGLMAALEANELSLNDLYILAIVGFDLPVKAYSVDHIKEIMEGMIGKDTEEDEE